MKKILSLAVCAAIFLSVGTAHAAVVDFVFGVASNTFATNAGGALEKNIHLQTPAPNTLVLNNNSQIVDPRHSSPGNFLNMQGALLDNNFLAVLGTGNPGLATFTLTSGQHSFGFTWGSIDTFNTIVLTDSRAVTYTFTGADILAQIGNPDPGKVNTQTDVRFVDNFGTIVSAAFSSTQNAFESANFSESAVPLPPAVILFGLGLITMFGFAQLKRVRSK